MTLKSVRWLPSFLLFVSCSATHSQSDALPVSAEIRRSTHVYRTFSNDSLSLDLRIPVPMNSQALGVVFMHGGGFSQGQRDLGPHTSFLDTLAANGIPSASISYRLTQKGRGFGCAVSVEEKQTAVELAAQDLMAALDWLKASPLLLPKEWAAAGSSAGAEAALWAGYAVAPEAWAGVISFAGAVSHELAVPLNAPPLFAAHGICDQVVPSQEGIHRECHAEDPGAWLLCGGLCWAQRLTTAEIGSSSYAYCGRGHEVCNAAMLDTTLQDSLSHWLSHPVHRGTTMDVSISEGGTFQSKDPRCLQPCH